MTKKTSLRLALAAVLMAIACFACLSASEVAYADEEGDAELQASIWNTGVTTDVYLGSGTIVTTKATFDQENVKSDLIEKIKEIRNEAYNEGFVIHGMPIMAYLNKLGMSKQDYTVMTWSNALERIAVQRTVESADSSIGSNRPNGSSCYTATYEGISADKEIQKWRNDNISSFDGDELIRTIYWERQNYLDEINGTPGKPYQNYLALIDPDYTCVGAATTDGYDKKFVGVVELGKKLQGMGGSDEMGLKGEYDFEMAVGGNSGGGDGDGGSSSKVGDVEFCMDVTGCYRMNIGTTYNFTASVTYRGKKVNIDADWYSSDPSVISIDADGKATAHKAGTVDIYVTGKDGYKVPHSITVPANIEMFREYNPYDGQHLFTMSAEERDYITSLGWNFENIGWVAPRWKKNPLYRVYNPYNGDHHYTMSQSEVADCVGHGWVDEGIACYSANANNGIEVYRLYNPFETVGYHHYTTAADEYNWLMNLGWQNSWVGEGVGWYALKQ